MRNKDKNNNYKQGKTETKELIEVDEKEKKDKLSKR
jgi:hypothetical protein